MEEKARGPSPLRVQPPLLPKQIMSWQTYSSPMEDGGCVKAPRQKRICKTSNHERSQLTWGTIVQCDHVMGHTVGKRCGEEMWGRDVGNWGNEAREKGRGQIMRRATVYQIKQWKLGQSYYGIEGKSCPGQVTVLERCPVHQKVSGSIPDQGTYLGCGFNPPPNPSQGAQGRQPIDVSLSHPCFSLFLSPFLPPFLSP